MDKETAIQILTDHNKWRRGEGEYGYGEMHLAQTYTPAEIGEAIDIAIHLMSEMKGGEE